MHHFVDVVTRRNESLQYVLALAGFPKLIISAANCDVMPVVDKITYTIFQCKKARTTFNQCDAIH